MNINKDGKTLFFSDDEIENNTNGQKKIYVTKRINGIESHSKIEKELNKKFDFNDEVVIGVTPKNTIKYNEKSRKKMTKNNIINNSKCKRKNNYHKKSKSKANETIKTAKNSRKRIKKKSSKKIIRFFSCLLLIGVIAIFAFTTPIFNINKIEINGNSQVSNENIISMSGLKKGENIFRFNSQVIHNIKENQYIEEVTIKRKLPGTVLITIGERSIKYQIKLINSYAYIDKNGYILEISSLKREVPVIVGFSITENDLINKKRLEIENLEKLNKIQKIMEAARLIGIDKIITEINIENEYYLYIESQNKKVFIGDTSNLTNKMLYLKRILEEEKENGGSVFVNGDISSGFRPYFRPE